MGDNAGVRDGWVILSINGEPQPDDDDVIFETIKKHKEIGSSISILFEEVIEPEEKKDADGQEQNETQEKEEKEKTEGNEEEEEQQEQLQHKEEEGGDKEKEEEE